MSFLNIMLLILYYYFSLEAVLQGMVISNSTEKQIDAEMQTNWSMGQRENSKFIAINCKDRFKS